MGVIILVSRLNCYFFLLFIENLETSQGMRLLAVRGEIKFLVYLDKGEGNYDWRIENESD